MVHDQKIWADFARQQAVLQKQQVQRLRQQQPQQSDSPLATPNSHNLNQVQQVPHMTTFSSMKMRQQHQRDRPDYPHVQAQQQLVMQGIANEQAQAAAMATLNQTCQAQQVRLNDTDNVLAVTFSKMKMSSRNPFEYTQSDFRTYELDVKTERQMFVNDLPASRGSSISTFSTHIPPPIQDTRDFSRAYQQPAPGDLHHHPPTYSTPARVL